jgi:hypothetical protein
MEPTCKIKILTFRNCELHCCHLDGYNGQRDVFLKRLNEIENFFMEKPDTSRFRIWYNVDDTLLDNDLINEIVMSVFRIQNHIVKIAFIGLKRLQQWHLARMLKSDKAYSSVPFACFADAEKAKEWLI